MRSSCLWPLLLSTSRCSQLLLLLLLMLQQQAVQVCRQQQQHFCRLRRHPRMRQ
jgi:hypothetical protein